MSLSAVAEAFARRLNEAIEESDIAELNDTQQAAELHLSKGLLSQWKGGRTAHPNYAKASFASDRLKINVDWLLENREPKRFATPSGGGEQQPKADNEFAEPDTMTPQQQKDAMNALMDYIPHTARDRYLKMIVNEALQEGWIKHVPDGMLADWSAKDKIDALQKRGTQ
jgi:hypothetical protein